MVSDTVVTGFWVGLSVMISKLFMILPLGAVKLGADLTGINGYTGRGVIEFSMRRGGMRRLAIALKGIAGQHAEIYANGEFAAGIALLNGAAESRFDSRRGDSVPVLGEGAHIEIRQNGDAILAGELIRA